MRNIGQYWETLGRLGTTKMLFNYTLVQEWNTCAPLGTYTKSRKRASGLLQGWPSSTQHASAVLLRLCKTRDSSRTPRKLIQARR